jgi:hypothetical protein
MLVPQPIPGGPVAATNSLGERLGAPPSPRMVNFSAARIPRSRWLATAQKSSRLGWLQGCLDLWPIAGPFRFSDERQIISASLVSFRSWRNKLLEG